jgi:hypothetical protein
MEGAAIFFTGHSVAMGATNACRTQIAQAKQKRPYIHIITTLLENWFIRISRTHFLYRPVSIVNTINKK